MLLPLYFILFYIQTSFNILSFATNYLHKRLIGRKPKCLCSISNPNLTVAYRACFLNSMLALKDLLYGVTLN